MSFTAGLVGATVPTVICGKSVTILCVIVKAVSTKLFVAPNSSLNSAAVKSSPGPFIGIVKGIIFYVKVKGKPPPPPAGSE